MLALSPEDHKDDPVLDRFLMLLVRDSSGRPAEILPPNPEEGRIRNFPLDRDREERFGVLREDP
jgi:hypothetical protein